MSNKPKKQTIARKQATQRKLFAIRNCADYDDSLGLIKKVTFIKL